MRSMVCRKEGEKEAVQKLSLQAGPWGIPALLLTL